MRRHDPNGMALLGEARNAWEFDYGDPLTWPEDPAARPYLDAKGNLVIPMDAPMRYRWWAGGQSPTQTRQELLDAQGGDHGLVA